MKTQAHRQFFQRKKPRYRWGQGLTHRKVLGGLIISSPLMNFQRESIKFAGHIRTSRDYMGYRML